MAGFKKTVKLFLLLFFFIIFSVEVFGEAKIDTSSGGGMIPKLPQTPNDPELLNGHVYPFWGSPCQRYTYSVIYRDKEGRAPEYVKIYFNGAMIDMDPTSPKASLGKKDYQQGVTYEYKFVPNKLESNFYYFEASNGLGKTRDSIIDSPDNGPVLFESAFDKNEIAVVDRESGQKIVSFKTKNEWIGGIAISDDGNYLAAKASKHIYFFDLGKSKEPVWKFDCEACNIGGDVKGGVDISGDGSRIIAAIGETTLLFDKSSNKPIWKYQKSANNSYNVAISKDGKYMAAATAGEESNSETNLLILWSDKSEKPLWQYHASGNFHDVSLSDDGNFIAGSTGCPDRKAYLFSNDSNVPLIQSDRLTRDSPVHRAKISADGLHFAVGSESDAGAVFLFSKENKEPLWKFSTPNGSSVRALNFTPSGEFIGAATFGGDVYIFNSQSNQPIKSWKVNAALGGVDIANDGSFIATGGTDNKLHIFNRDSDEDKEISFDEYLEEVDISGNGKYIAAGTGGSVYFFETFSKNEGKVFDCSSVIEPSPESTMLGSKEGGGCGFGVKCAENLDQTNSQQPFVANTSKKLPGMLFGFGFLGSLFSLIGYLAVVKFNLLKRSPENLLKVNKKIIIILSIISFLFLILTLVAAFFNRNPQAPVLKNAAENAKPEAGNKQEQQGVCGNSYCEPSLGETKENCSKDCSGGD